MKNPWTRFLFLRLPAAALVMMLAAQALAFVLSGVPMRRDRPDELALAVWKDPANYRILLLADSTTRNATVRFSLGGPDEVANLATNAYIGLNGSLFLLQRYLSAHPSPEHVVIALGPVLYHNEHDLRTVRYNLWHTFNQPDERDFLSTFVPGIGQRDWAPAIVDIQERLAEPFLSFLKQRYLMLAHRETPRIEAGRLAASADAPVELAARAETAPDGAFAERLGLTMAPMHVEALNRLCDLSKKHGFRVDMAWPPMPAQLHGMLTSSGALAELEGRIRSIMEGRCDFRGFTDFNVIRAYPNRSFHNDLLHLFGDGWEQRYSADMRDYLGGLLRQRHAQAGGPSRLRVSF
jgi:hypothetical protein